MKHFQEFILFHEAFCEINLHYQLKVLIFKYSCLARRIKSCKLNKII